MDWNPMPRLPKMRNTTPKPPKPAVRIPKPPKPGFDQMPGRRVGQYRRAGLTPPDAPVRPPLDWQPAPKPRRPRSPEDEEEMGG